MHVRLTLMLHPPVSTEELILRPTFRHLILALLLSLLAWHVLAELDSKALQQQLISRFGPARVGLLNDWLQMTNAAKTSGEELKLRRVNDFINQHIVFESDMSVWQQSDYWATPLETIGQGGGDCEDFAIIKYVSLRMAGVPIHKLRLVYVKATLKAAGGGLTQQAHMVLAYYATPTADPLVLDNLNPQILPASRRSDLSPIFSFNSAGLWQGTGNNASKSSLSRWQDLLDRARAEGFQ